MAYRIQQLYVYPIKGIAGNSVNEAYAEEMGFRYDRRWLITNEKGRFLSQRTHPELVKISAEIGEHDMVVKHGDVKLVVPFDQHSENHLEAEVWNHMIKSYEVSKMASEWFSDILSEKVLFVTRGEDSERKKSLIKYPYTSEVSYADGYPYLGLGSASLEDLSNRLNRSINALAFRPNIVFDTTIPYEEDDFDHLSVNEVKLRGIKPCARCQVVDIDPLTGVSTKGTLATLAGYRRKGNNVYMGVNMICRKEGWLRVGDVMK
ncbi:MAG: MOSC N-terminal beta barrel domain-containing protein [Saprospiraceae bacterium]|nr:MOSC N-terminal beta barrel domain-containing protein [Saprospiraceae bacterium]